MWCDNSYLGGRVLIMVGSRGTLVVLFQWRVRYVPIQASSLSSWNSPHEYHTYHEYKYLNTGKHQHPKSSNAKKRIWSHWQHHGTSAPQPDKASPRFDIRFPPRPSRNSMWICDIWANIVQICKCAKNTEKHLWHLLKQQTPFRSYPVARQFTSPSVLAISVLKHLQSHHFYCWCKPHIHPYPSWPQEWKQHSTSYKKFRFYPQFLWIPC